MNDRTMVDSARFVYAPDLPSRLQADRIYAQTEPIYISNLPVRNDFKYLFGIEIKLPPMLPQAKTIEELSWGLFGIYDERRNLVGLIDTAKEIENQTLTNKLDPIQAILIDTNQLTDPLQQKAFMDIFAARGAAINSNEIGTAVDFFAANHYRPYAGQLAQQLDPDSDPMVHYKLVPFNSCYQSWKYLEEKKKNKPEQFQEYRQKINELMSWRNEGLFLGIFSNKFSALEIDELIDKLIDLKNDKTHSVTAPYFHLRNAFLNLEESKWVVSRYQGGPLEKYHSLLNEFKEEELHVLSKSLQFMVREFHATRQDHPEFVKRYEYFNGLFGALEQIFNPDPKTRQRALENLNINPDIFDKLIFTNTVEGRNSLRDLWYLILQAGSQAVQEKAQTEQDNDPFYARFFDRFLQALYHGTIIPEKTTGDTYIEQQRFKNAIEFAINAKKLDAENLSVLEIGIGTGRIMNWLIDKFPKMKAFGIDIIEEKKLRKYGLSDKIRFKQINILDLTPEVLKEAFNLNKVDVLIAPWSFFGDLSDNELEQVLTAIKQIAKVVISDNPLTTVQNRIYMDQMRAGSQPHRVAINFTDGGNLLTKFIWGRPPERLIQLHEQKNIRVMNIPSDSARNEQFYVDLRTQPLVRTTDISIPQWTTAVGRQRITLIGDCTSVHEAV